MKKMISIFIIITLLTNVYGYELTQEYERVIDGENYIYQVYEVSKEEEANFSIAQEINTEDGEYELYQYSTAGGDYEEQIEIKTTKKMTSLTDNKEKIIELLPQTIDYNKDGYVGKYELDINSIETQLVYNGYKEYLVDESVEYYNLDKNDLSYIPKQIIKGNYKLDLITTEWIPMDKTNIGDNEVVSLYTAKCYYATKYKKDNPYTYAVTASYNGSATKIIEAPYEYILQYKKIIKESNNTSNVILGSASAGFFVIILLIIVPTKAKIYVKEKDNYRYLGSYICNKHKTVIDITNKSKKYINNEYLITMNKRLAKKLNKKAITLKKNNISKLFIVENNNGFSIEIKI